MANERTAKIIRQLKEIREKRELTYQNILDMVEESGNYVSFSTIRRVFAEGSEEQNFKYHDSIKPIAIALIGKEPTEPQDGETKSIAEMETNALREIALHKEDMIQELHAENQRLQDEYAIRINYLKEESTKKSEHIATLTAQLSKKDRTILTLAAGLIGLLMLICVTLFVDVSRLDIGFVRNIAGTPLAIVGAILALILGVVVYTVYRRTAKK